MRNTPESRACGILHGNCTRKCCCWQAQRRDDRKNARGRGHLRGNNAVFTLPRAWLSMIDLYFITSTMKMRDKQPVVLSENARWLREHKKGIRRIHG